MQKNLSIKSLADAQKNLRWFGIVVVLVNLLFLSLGVLLYLFAASKGIAIPEKTDDLFPMLALNHLGAFAAVIFILGLTAATFSSADSVLTTLTTSLYIDILGIEKNNTRGPDQKRRIRNFIHILFAVLLLVIILLFKAFNEKAIIDTVLLIATYTYGPLLGMFAFGIFSKKKPKDIYIPLVCLAAPCLCYVLSTHSVDWFGGYQFSYEILPLNGLLTYFGLSLLPPNKVTNGKNQE